MTRKSPAERTRTHPLNLTAFELAILKREQARRGTSLSGTLRLLIREWEELNHSRKEADR